MTYITSLPPAAVGAISGFSFISTMTLMALCLYQYISTGSISGCRKNLILFACNAVLLSYVTAAVEKDHVYKEIPVPFGLLIAIAVAVMIYSVINVRRQFLENRNTPSPASIKQTLDNLDSGICFADNLGRIILINHAMSKLMAYITESTPQTIYEINEFLEGLVHDENSLYHFINGEVWSFQSVLISDGDVKKTAVFNHSNITDRLTDISHKAFTQLTAHNVTELYNINNALRQSSDELQRTNEKTTLMLNRLADRIREQETLNLKIQVHNDIGTSLIAISEILEESSVPATNNVQGLTGSCTTDEISNARSDINLQIKYLQNAVSYFTTTHNSHSDSLDELINEADNMNITLTLNGDSIDDERIWSVTATALRECMTNTVKHAGGTDLSANIILTEGYYTITISNTGAPPADSIHEGGGLGNLRSRVTSIGGSMNIKSEPAFTLKLVLPEHPVIQIPESVNPAN